MEKDKSIKETDSQISFLNAVKDFVDSIDSVLENVIKGKRKKAFNGYKLIIAQTKVNSLAVKKLIEGFKTFFEGVDYLLFSEHSICEIKTKIFYSNNKSIYIPVDFLIEITKEEDVIRDFLIRISHLIEDSQTKKETKRKFILSRQIFGLQIDDSTPEGEFICKCIIRAKELITLDLILSIKEPQGLLPVLMSLLTSNKLNTYTEEIKKEWIEKNINLPSLMRRMADIIENMNFDPNPQMLDLRALPPLLKSASEEVKRYEDSEKD